MNDIEVTCYECGAILEDGEVPEVIYTVAGTMPLCVDCYKEYLSISLNQEMESEYERD